MLPGVLSLVRPSLSLSSLARAAISTMSSKTVKAQSDISIMKTSDDGTFKRAPSSFRNVIEKGGKFEPELGEQQVDFYRGYILRDTVQVATIYTFPMLVVRE